MLKMQVIYDGIRYGAIRVFRYVLCWIEIMNWRCFVPHWFGLYCCDGVFA